MAGNTKNIIEASFSLLKNYCEKEEYKGWDPFDGLNSRIFQYTPFNKSRFFRLAWLQFFKKCPINFRPAAAVPNQYNPKALGLFLSGYCNLLKVDQNEIHLGKIEFLIKKIEGLQSKGWSGSCWGYNFDWQARAFFHPAYTPTVVATSFIAESLLDAYEITGKENLLKMARSACDFILKDLNRTHDENGNFCFSYSPIDKSQIINATLLGARLLSRVFSFTGERDLAEAAKTTVQYCVKRQNIDGSWVYGTLPHHRFIDSFHSGYNLECLADYMKFTGNKEFQANLQLGWKFYLANFFTDEGVPKYYDDTIFPIDIHAPAQLAATLLRNGILEKERKLLENVLMWTIKNMQDKEKGFFYYQKNNWFTVKIPYMRWSQAWMFYAFSIYLSATSPHNNQKAAQEHL